MTPEARNSQNPLGVIFDGDDTLWSTEQLYDEARSDARRVVEESGLDGERWEQRERLIDVQNVAKFGYSVERFPTSCVQAYEELCMTEGRTVDKVTSQLIRQAAKSVFERDPPLISGARETLKFLRAKGVRLGLLTKGDFKLQTRRIERSGLCKLFDIVKIVTEKSPAIILEVVAELGVDVRAAWMVGNSLRSDVFPAMKAGLRAIWIPAHVWEYERSNDDIADKHEIIKSHLAEIPALII